MASTSVSGVESPVRFTPSRCTSGVMSEIELSSSQYEAGCVRTG
jgi:hypothetical protein